MFFKNPELIDLNTNLVAGWSFDDTTTDFIGSKAATVIGSTTYNNTIKKSGKAIDFDNTSGLNYLTYDDSDDFSFPLGTYFSISLWVYIYSKSSTANFLISKRLGSTVNGSEWQIVVRAAGDFALQCWNQDDTSVNLIQVNGSAVSVPTLNTWHHLVFTSENTLSPEDMNMYWNGVEILGGKTSIGTYTGMTNTGSKLAMGIFNNSTSISQGTKHRGLIDECYIWKDRLLTRRDALRMYKQGVGKFYPF